MRKLLEMKRRDFLLGVGGALGSLTMMGDALASDDNLRVTRFHGATDEEVPTASVGGPWPAGLIIPPGNYMPAAPHDFTQPGLYQSWIPKTDSPIGVQWVYYRMVVGNPYDLASAVSWANIFGWDDFWPVPGPSDAEMINTLMGNGAPGMLLNAPCGPHVTFLQKRAAELGYDFRVTRMLTAEAPNSYSDGHVSCEMRVGTDPWLVYDPSYAHIYKNAQGNQLNLADLVNGFHAGTTQFEKIAHWRFGNRDRLGTYQVNGVTQGQWSSDAWSMMNQHWTQDGLEATIKRAYQVPFIQDPVTGEIVGYVPSGVSMAMDIPAGFNLISESAFRARFYG